MKERISRGAKQSANKQNHITPGTGGIMYELRTADHTAGSQVRSTESHNGMFLLPTRGWLGLFSHNKVLHYFK